MCKVVCQFEIRSLGCGPCAEVSGATLCDENVVLRSKAAPRTRYGPLQNVPRGVDVAVNLHLAMRASVDADLQILPD